MSYEKFDFKESILKKLTEYITEEKKRPVAELENPYLTLKIENYSNDKSKDVTVCINGNQSSLIHFALHIVDVAFGDFDNYHMDMGSVMFSDYDGELSVSLKENF